MGSRAAARQLRISLRDSRDRPTLDDPDGKGLEDALAIGRRCRGIPSAVQTIALRMNPGRRLSLHVVVALSSPFTIVVTVVAFAACGRV
jgi:hypothetical protein